MQGVAEIQHLKRLVIFNAAENRISRISMDVLLHLRSLKALVLNDNAITTLDWIPKLPVRSMLLLLPLASWGDSWANVVCACRSSTH
jgi:hypothetical protein